MAGGKKKLESGFYSSELVTFILGLVAWVLPAQEILPLFINCLVVLAALWAAGAVLWGWNETRGWLPLRRIGIWSVSMLVVFAALAPALKKQYEREYDSGIQFKESPEIDWWYSFLIRRDCTKMRDYLHELKIPVPDETPPIGVQHGQAASAKYELSADPNVPVYRREILISERDALEGNIRAFTDRYADYVMLIDLMMKQLKQHGPNDTQSVNLFYAESAFGPYFNWSFWGENKGSSVSSWSDYFWNLRTKFGKDYADQLAAYTVRTLIDNPEEGMDANHSVYVCRHLRTAFGVIDNGAKKWPEIVAALGNPKLQDACPAN